jgi:hypothetical protein
MQRLSVVLLLACACLVEPRAFSATPENVAADQATLRAAGVGTDGPALVTFLRKRTLGEKDRERIDALIKQLGSDDFEEREKASRALVDIGPAARAQLQPATRDKDLEVSRRARRALDEIGKSSSPVVLAAAVRVLVHHKPATATEVLLNYLGSADDPDVVEDVVAGLAVVGVKDGKVSPVLLKALGDKVVVKRAGAGTVVARIGGAAHRPAVRKLLADENQTVRARVGMTLVEMKDKEAIPTLIDLIEKGANDDRDRVEEMLTLLAGEKAPASVSGTDAAARRKYRQAWDGWYKEHGKGLDLAKVEFGARMLGYMLVCTSDIRGRINGRVQEIDKAGKVRWTIDGLRYPVFASVKRDRVVIAEQTFNRISERSLKGALIWQKQVSTAIVGAHRRHNGNIFVIGRNQLIELDKDGKEVLTINRPSFDIMTGARDKDGGIGIVTTNGRFVRLDSAGKELRSFAVGFLSSGFGTNIQLLPRGRVLIPDYGNNKVKEYDDTGKVVWQADVVRPTSVRRLPNGHTLVTSRLSRTVIELDRTGRQVWSKTFDAQVFYADKR